MENNKFTEEIRSYGKHIFKELHEHFRFNFEAPFAVFRFEGTFTLGQARKVAARNGFDDSAQKVFLVKEYGIIKTLFAIEMVENEVHPVTDSFRRMVARKGCDLSYYKYRSDFTEARKSECTVAFLVCQNQEHLSGYHSIPRITWRDRCKLVNPQFDEDDGLVYAQKVFVNNKEVATYGEWFDRSGYCVGMRRRELREKACDLRAKRKADGVDYDDAAKRWAEIDTAIKARKMELVEMLLNAKTDREFREVADSIYYYRRLQTGKHSWEVDIVLKGFSLAVGHANSFEKKLNGKEFASMKEMVDTYNAVFQYLPKRI